jgi:hypothetical protein
MNEEKSKAITERLGRFQMLWPDVKTEKGIDDAIKGGAASAGYIAVSYAVGIVLLLIGRGAVVGMGGNAETTLGFIVINGLLTVIATALAWLIWKKRNLIAAVIGLAWIVFEVAAKLATMSGGRGIIVAILALIFAVNGVRGALAERKRTAEPSPAA